MQFRSIAILLGTSAFALTFAISSWQRGLWHRTPSIEHAHAQARALPPRGWAFAFASQPSYTRPDVLPTPPPSSTPVALASENDAATEPADSSDDDPNADAPAPQPMPLRVLFHPLPDGSGLTADLRNTSSQALDVTVTTSNPSTGNQSSVQMTIDPHSTADLSAAGLIVEHGDNVAITSPPYVDRRLYAN